MSWILTVCISLGVTGVTRSSRHQRVRLYRAASLTGTPALPLARPRTVRGRCTRVPVPLRPVSQRRYRPPPAPPRPASLRRPCTAPVYLRRRPGHPPSRPASLDRDRRQAQTRTPPPAQPSTRYVPSLHPCLHARVLLLASFGNLVQNVLG